MKIETHEASPARRKSKLSQLREYMAAGDWRAALRLADSFGDLGAEKAVIERGWAAFQNPAFYESINRRPDTLISAAVAALIRRYGDPALNFEDASFK